MITLEQEIKRPEPFLLHDSRPYMLAEIFPHYRYSEDTVLHIAKCIEKAGNEVIFIQMKDNYGIYLRKND